MLVNVDVLVAILPIEEITRGDCSIEPVRKVFCRSIRLINTIADSKAVKFGSKLFFGQAL